MSEKVIFYTRPLPPALDQDTGVVALVYGQTGYYPVATDRTPEELNEAMKVPQDLIEAAEAGSLFGWDVPGAKAATDFAEARLEEMRRAD